jgi:phenylacetate-CoA ligase
LKIRKAKKIVKAYPLSSIVALAREGSPFYRKLYAHLPEDPALTDLPVLDQAEFWSAHQRDRREVLTAPLTGGIVLNSGGTTGAPKFSYVYEDEWKSNVEISVKSFDAGLQDGDRVANLFVAGGLYASYLFATDSLRFSAADVLHLPIGYFNALPDTARLIRELEVSVLMGPPTFLLKLIEHLEKEGIGQVRIRSLLYAGENFTEGQCAYLETVFPGLAIHSAGYASVDVGAMAFADAGCAPGEHRAFDGATHLEILSEETDERIEEAGRPGRVIFTSLVRRLMPIIRYPAGDRAIWLEPPGTPMRKFRLLGRAEEAARLANIVLVRVDDVHSLLAPFRERLGIRQLQLRLTKEGERDRLTLCLVGSREPAELAEATPEILSAFKASNQMLEKAIEAGSAAPTQIAWIAQADLAVGPRTGKTLAIVDLRPR